jgi:hypothetical protein
MIVHHNNVQVNHQQVEHGDQNLVYQMKHEIIFVVVQIHRIIVGDDQMKIIVGVNERKNV